jgi:hypothetical protein
MLLGGLSEGLKTAFVPLFLLAGGGESNLDLQVYKAAN